MQRRRAFPIVVIIETLVIAATVGMLVLAASCHTVEAVAELPEGFWWDAWGLIEAFVQDVVEIVTLLL